ncbi:MAG: peptidylprolyl isomerase [Bryobacteraceae bacterium]
MHTKLVVPLCALAVAGAALAADPPSQEVRILEQIVAKINGEIITRSELDRARSQMEAEIARQRLPSARAEQLLKEGVENLLRDRIDNLLLVQKAKDLNIDVDQEVAKSLAQLQLASKIPDVDKFQAAIREQSGMSYEDFRAQTREGLLTREVVHREVGSRIVVSKAEQTAYYEQHKQEFVREEQVILREILLSTDGRDAAGIAAAEKKARDLVARARKGENFANLAHDNSDADTASNYGELPPFKHGTLKKELEEVVFNQPRGYVTEPIRLPNGFLILRVEDHYRAGQQPFEAVENEIMERLYMPRMQPALRAYLTKLRENAFVEIRAGYVDSGAAPGKDTAWHDPTKLRPQTITKEEVAAHVRHRRLLFLVPVPGTKIGGKVERPIQAAPAGAPPAAAPAKPGAPATTPGTPQK